MHLVHAEHISDGFLAKAEMSQVPHIGEHVVINNTEYEVKNVKWNFSGLKIVTLILEETKF